MANPTTAIDHRPLTLSIVSHGHGPLLTRLLDQLNATPSLSGTHVVVTLNLHDETFDASPYTRLDLTVIRNPLPRGFGANHNAAFERCRTAWFGVLNPDLTLTEREPFKLLQQRANTVPRVGVIAPRVLSTDRLPEDSVRSNLTPWSLVGRRLLGERAPLEVSHIARRGSRFYWVAGMCMLVNAKAFKTIGGFDERFFLYCEDYDLCARMYNEGYAIALEPEAEVIHEAQRDSHRSLRHMRWHLESLLRVWLSRAFWRVTLASQTL